MRFTLQFTADYVNQSYGIIKQSIFNCDDVDSAYIKQKDILESFLNKRKTENGFTGAFIGYTLKLWDGSESDFEIKREHFEIFDNPIDLKVIGWYDSRGDFHKGNPNIKSK